jgi:hypothetical protein
MNNQDGFDHLCIDLLRQARLSPANAAPKATLCDCQTYLQHEGLGAEAAALTPNPTTSNH